MKLSTEDRNVAYKNIQDWCARNEHITYLDDGLVEVSMPSYEKPEGKFQPKRGSLYGAQGIVVDLSTINPTCYAHVIAVHVFNAGLEQGRAEVRNAINQALGRE